MLTDSEISILTDGLRESSLGSSIDQASRDNPDKWAYDKKLAEGLKITVDEVRMDPVEAERRSMLSGDDIKALFADRPGVAEYMTNPDNAKLSIDDTKSLGALEESFINRNARRGRWENQARGFANNSSKIVTEGLAGAAWASQMLLRPVDYVLDKATLALTGEEGQFSERSKGAADEVRQFMQERDLSSEAFYDFKNRADIKKVIESPTPANIGSFIIEAGPSQIPYMIAAGISYPAIVAVVGNMVAEDRVKNNELTGLPSDIDMLIGAVTAGLTGLVERFSLGKLIKSGKAPKPLQGFLPYAAKEVGKGTVIEAGTEFVQEGIEAIGGSIGTKKGVQPQDVFEQALGGALVGAGMGASIRAATVRSEYSKKVFNVALKDSFKRLESSEAQDMLEDLITMSQSSLTNERSPEAFADFLTMVDPDAYVLMSAEIAAEVGYEVDGTGADISIPMGEFLSKFARDEELLTKVRPHIKVREDLLTQSELEAKVGDSDQVKRLIERASKNEAALTEAQEIYEKVKDQIVNTRRQGRATAQLSAELIPASLVARQAELKKEFGVDVTIQELYEDMGLTVVGPTKDTDEKDTDEGVQLSQDEQNEYDRAVAKGMDMSEPARMQRALDMGATDDVSYHGTGSNIRSFLRDFFGSATGAKSAKQGVWSVSEPNTARGYAEYAARGAKVKKLMDEAGILEENGDWDGYDAKLAEAEQLQQEIDDQPNQGQNILALRTLGKFMEKDMEGAEFTDVKEEMHKTISRARLEGFDGVKFLNLSDDVGFNGRPATHTLTFDPKNIRSVNAAFDPDYSSSPQLLAQQEFGDIELSDTIMDEGGNAVQVREKAQTAWDYHQQRLKMVEQLRLCANG